MTIVDRLRALPRRSRDRLRLAVKCFVIKSALIAATVVLVGDWLWASFSNEPWTPMPEPEAWLWALILFVGCTVIERRTKRYRRAYPKRPLTLKLR